MGNSDLRDIAAITEVDANRIENATVAVDAYNWLYKYVTTTVQFTNEDEYTTQSGVEVPNLHGGLSGLKRFYDNDITPVFVFDGGAHDLKEDELQRRKESKKEAEEKASEARERGDRIEAAKMDARTQRLTNPMIRSSMELFDALNIPYTAAPQSGESQAAFMVRTCDAYDYVVSEDYDTLLFQSPATVRNFTSSSRPFEWMDFYETLDANDITHEQLVDVAILCGTDYNDGVTGYGPKTALKKIKEHGSYTELMEKEDINVEAYDDVREIFLNPDVTEEYPEPQSSQVPDIEEARELLIEKWELPEDLVNSRLDDIDEMTKQQTLDDW